MFALARVSVSSIFFFLNDPPPTEFYPLPLPAPLPIRGATADRGGHAQPVDGRRPDELHPAPPLQLGVHLGRDQRRLAGAQHVFGEALAELLGRKVGVDRKSTRLNSSH